MKIEKFIKECYNSKPGSVHFEYLNKFNIKFIEELENNSELKLSLSDVLALNSKDLFEREIKGIYYIYAKDKKGNLFFTYVGQSKDVLNRWKTHGKSIVSKRHKRYYVLQEAIRNDDLDLKDVHFFLIEKSEDKQQRYRKEIYYIISSRGNFNKNIKINNFELECPNKHKAGGGQNARKFNWKYKEDKDYKGLQITSRCKSCEKGENIFELYPDFKIIK